jgi:hypothetical protein
MNITRLTKTVKKTTVQLKIIEEIHFIKVSLKEGTSQDKMFLMPKNRMTSLINGLNYLKLQNLKIKANMSILS